MYYLNPNKQEYRYHALQTSYAPGLIEFPDEFLSEFYKEGKRAAGFVNIEYEVDVRHIQIWNEETKEYDVMEEETKSIQSCVWDEEAYQAWLELNPETEPVVKITDTDVLNALLGVTE